ncbi:hypothetical protein GCM10017707_34220 [Paenarthrobacter aurescens]
MIPQLGFEKDANFLLSRPNRALGDAFQHWPCRPAEITHPFILSKVACILGGQGLGRRLFLFSESGGLPRATPEDETQGRRHTHPQERSHYHCQRRIQSQLLRKGSHEIDHGEDANSKPGNYFSASEGNGYQ